MQNPDWNKPICAVYFRIIVFILLALFTLTCNAMTSDAKRVLLISSYHPGFPTFFQQIEGVKAGLAEAGFEAPKLVLDVEFMDSKRFYSVQLIADFYQRLAAKLNNLPPYDLIMTADDNATRAAVERRTELFGDTPLVFFGVNDRSFALSQNLSPQVTGVVEATSILETAQLASRLSPQHPLVVVADATPSGQSDLAGFRRQIEAKLTTPPRILSLANLSFSDLEAALRLLAPDSSLLLLSAYRDKNGVTRTFNDSLEKVLAAYPGRVFHLWEHGIGQGILGGVVISHFEQGRAAAALGARIFNGEPSSALAVVRDSPNLSLFDHEVLQLHGIARSSLPIDSRIINQPRGGIELSTEELAWLRDHKKIRVGGETDWAPYAFVGDSGRFAGIAQDYLKVIAEKLGIELEIVTGPTWGELLQMARDNQIDALPAIYHSEDKKAYLHFTGPYVRVTEFIFTRNQTTDVSDMADLKGRSVAVVSGYATQNLLHTRYPEVEVVTAPSIREALKKVVTGEADAFIGDIASTQYNIQRYALSGIRAISAAPSREETIRMAVRQDWPELRNLIDKVLGVMTPAEHNTIRARWLTNPRFSHAKLSLTPEEQSWIAQHQTITMGVDPDFAPYEWIDENGKYVGIAADFLNLISKRLGIRFEVKQNLSWEKASAMGRAKQLDIHPMLTPTDERKKSYLFTRTYVRDPYVIIQNKNQRSIADETQLGGKRVALVRGYSATELTLNNQPKLIPVYVDTEIESLLAVAANKVDATVGHLGSLTDKIRQNHLTNLKIAAYTKFKTKGMGIAVRNDMPMLRNLLDRALASISPEEQREISQRWIILDETELVEQLNLSPEESDWLSNHPVVRVLMDPSWAPVEFIDAEGLSQGIAVDYLNLIEDLLGIKLEIATGLSWKDGVQAMRDKRLDMASAVARTREREGFAVFTEPYISMPVNIFARNDVLYIGRLENLAGKRVAVVEDYAVTEWLTQDHPEIVQVPVTAPGEALQMVADGSVIAFVGNVVTASYYIGKLSLHSVRVAGETPYSYDQAMAVRDDWPIFAGILQKALDAIDQPQRDAIYNRWMSIRYEVEADYSLLWQVLAVVAVVLALFLYWNRRLAREITARQQTELALNHAKDAAEAARESAESANRAKSIFLANMSHELRTPLNAILGFSEILEKHVEASQDQKEKLGIISRSGKHLLNMINDVLDLSKIEAGRVEIDNEIFNLKKQIEETAQIFSEKARSTGLEFTLFFDSGLPDFIEADRNKLNQILINLFGNADKFTMYGGYSLHVESNPITDDPPREQLLLTVSDTGPGIDPELQQRIFEPFTQEGRTVSTTKGTGLGLSICKSYAELMGGHISIESKPGKGSQFRVELPIMPVQRPQESGKEMVFDSVQGLAPGQDDIRVMVVEDNDENRLLLTLLLKNAGFKVRDVVDGEQAVSMFEQWRPDFIWMDMRMPVKDGYQATAEIRQLPGGDDVAIVALTASALKKESKIIIDSGCDDVLHKPYTSSKIFEQMHKHLGVRYTYSDNDEKTDGNTFSVYRDQLMILPESLIKTLREVALGLNRDDFLSAVDQVRDIDQDLADGLAKLAKEFRFDELLDVISNSKDKKHS